jgi:hypothetical protein
VFTLPPVISSAEVIGTLTLRSGSSYSFYCSFGSATIAFLWIDDHLVCQIGAYMQANISLAPAQPTLNWGQDNPFTVLRRTALPVRLHVYKLQPGSSEYLSFLYQGLHICGRA